MLCQTIHATTEPPRLQEMRLILDHLLPVNMLGFRAKFDLHITISAPCRSPRVMARAPVYALQLTSGFLGSSTKSSVSLANLTCEFSASKCLVWPCRSSSALFIRLSPETQATLRSKPFASICDIVNSCCSLCFTSYLLFLGPSRPILGD